MNNYETFDQINDKKLQAYNRSVQMSNLLEDFGGDAAKAYGALFDKADQLRMFAILGSIRHKGAEATLKDVLGGMELVPNG